MRPRSARDYRYLARGLFCLRTCRRRSRSGTIFSASTSTPRSIKPGTDQIRIAFIKINDHQHIELFTDAPPSPPNMMSHYCFSVSNVEQMRAYLRSKGFDVKPGNGGKTRTGDYAFEIKDPDGTLIEFVQSLPTGIEMQDAGKFMPPTRIPTRSITWVFWWETWTSRWLFTRTYWASRRHGAAAAMARS